MDKKLLKRVLKFTTKRWADAHYPKKEKPKPLSEKAAAVKDFLLTRPFDCNTPKAEEFASLLLGEQLCDAKDDIIHLEQYIVVVPRANGNGHDYPLFEPVLVVGKSSGDILDGSNNWYALNTSGRKGNTLFTEFSAIRPATPKEIDWFVATTKPNMVMGHLAVWLETIKAMMPEPAKKAGK